ncbi:MAG: cupin domain-containing protein [Roseicyclus sp.]|uniref:cupin domain-containing protein n=1 Tax=Roseicyclus sp. TaxID=1914329 RepID=UPI003A8C085D
MQTNDCSFDWCIAPVSPETFFADHYEKAPLRIARDDHAYYADLLGFDDIDRVVSTMGLSVPEIAVTRAAGDITPADYAYESGFVDPVRVNQLFADGATVILSGLHERLPRLAAFCRALESVFSARVQTNIYMTQAESQGFRAHYDDHDVLVLQVAGTKEWRFYGTPVELPLTTQAFNPAEVEIGPETERFVLQPGDMLYVPRGLAHDAVATGEPSLHITTGLMCRTWADVLVEAVNVMAHRDPDLRRALPPGFANRGHDHGRHQADFEEMLARIARDAPLAKLLDGFKQDFLTGRVPRAHGQMAEMAKLKHLAPDSRVSARPHLIHDLTSSEADGTVRLVCQGAEIELPDFARDTLEAAVSARDIRVGDLPGDLDDAGKLVLVRRLVREGLMVIH